MLNIFLFLPFGLLARHARWPLLRTVLVFGLFSLGIEVTQGTLLVGRDASLGDVLSNTLGAGIGWLFWPGLLAAARPHPRFGLCVPRSGWSP